MQKKGIPARTRKEVTQNGKHCLYGAQHYQRGTVYYVGGDRIVCRGSASRHSTDHSKARKGSERVWTGRISNARCSILPRNQRAEDLLFE